ncbi:hypothetical protein HYT23_01235 [Candidatus Pacearchaeota archaeon]|nr:hypothetical protein [Candidatus Pacearchaeota archaeon]
MNFIDFIQSEDLYFTRLQKKSSEELIARQREVSVRGPIDFLKYIYSGRWQEAGVIEEILRKRAFSN